MATGAGKEEQLNAWGTVSIAESCMNNILSDAEKAKDNMCACANNNNEVLRLDAIEECDLALKRLEVVDIVNINDEIKEVKELRKKLKNPNWSDIISDAGKLSEALAKKKEILSVGLPPEFHTPKLNF